MEPSTAPGLTNPNSQLDAGKIETSSEVIRCAHEYYRDIWNAETPKPQTNYDGRHMSSVGKALRATCVSFLGLLVVVIAGKATPTVRPIAVCPRDCAILFAVYQSNHIP
jgi:hypothetical protein